MPMITGWLPRTSATTCSFVSHLVVTQSLAAWVSWGASMCRLDTLPVRLSWIIIVYGTNKFILLYSLKFFFFIPAILCRLTHIWSWWPENLIDGGSQCLWTRKGYVTYDLSNQPNAVGFSNMLNHFPCLVLGSLLPSYDRHWSSPAAWSLAPSWQRTTWYQYRIQKIVPLLAWRWNIAYKDYPS